MQMQMHMHMHMHMHMYMHMYIHTYWQFFLRPPKNIYIYLFPIFIPRKVHYNVPPIRHQ